MLKKVFERNRSIALQLFAEETPPTDPTPAEPKPADPKPAEPKEPEKKYTDADVDEILNKKFAKWQKEQEKKTSEAERLGRMTEAEKAAERMKSLEDKVQKYERDAAVAEMTKQARAILQDKNINVGDELISNLIGEDAETTKAAVESFITAFNKEVEKRVKEAYKGETPKKGGGATLTREQILAIPNRAERQQKINENMELFK